MFSIETEKKTYTGPRTPDELQYNERMLCEAISPMKIRDDSKLSWKYITGETQQRTLRSVAGEIVTVNLIYQRTDYNKTIEDSLRKMATEIRQNGVSWSAAWTYTKNYGVVAFKLMHLASFMRRQVSNSIV